MNLRDNKEKLLGTGKKRHLALVWGQRWKVEQEHSLNLCQWTVGSGGGKCGIQLCFKALALQRCVEWSGGRAEVRRLPRCAEVKKASDRC